MDSFPNEARERWTLFATKFWAEDLLKTLASGLGLHRDLVVVRESPLLVFHCRGSALQVLGEHAALLLDSLNRLQSPGYRRGTPLRLEEFSNVFGHCLASNIGCFCGARLKLVALVVAAKLDSAMTRFDHRTSSARRV